MKITATAAVVSVFAGLASAASTCLPRPPPRPTVVAAPYAPPAPHYKSPARSGQICYVRAKGNGADDSQTFYSALKACNNGGTVYLPDPDYTFTKVLDLTFLNAIDVVISGTISFSTDMNYWTGHTFGYQFQGAELMWQWGGFDVNLYGGGTINGTFLLSSPTRDGAAC